MPAAADIDGILLLDKPAGLSSNAALQQVKHLLHARKAGHGGSLDPLASGMLPICLGEATKLAGAMLEGRKCYEFCLRLGLRTSTGDREGDFIEERAVPDLTPDEVQRVLANFIGKGEQVPPMHSALKHKGERLYELARRGVEVDRPARAIEIASLDIVLLTLPRLTLRLICSKGTYVRTLAQDVAAALGSCGHVESLRRLWVEPFIDAPMITLTELEAVASLPAELEHWLLPPDRGVGEWPRVDLDVDEARRLLDGQSLTLTAGAVGEAAIRIYGPAGRFLGIAHRDHRGRITPRRLIASTRDRIVARSS